MGLAQVESDDTKGEKGTGKKSICMFAVLGSVQP